MGFWVFYSFKSALPAPLCRVFGHRDSSWSFVHLRMELSLCEGRKVCMRLRQMTREESDID